MSGTSTRNSATSTDTDWERLHGMTDEEAEANARANPDNPPITGARLATLKRVPQVKVLRRALRLSQEEFAERYAIPLEILREWETGKASPERAELSYLRVIAQEPEMTARALRTAAPAA